MSFPCSVTNSQGVGCKNQATRLGGICRTHQSRIIRHGDVQADRPIRAYTLPEEPVFRPLIPGTTEEEKLWNRIIKGREHWHWTGSLMSHGQTPQAIWKGFNHSVPRIIWELFFGPVPEGGVVRRTCTSNRCVKPDHLTMVGAEMQVAA